MADDNERMALDVMLESLLTPTEEAPNILTELGNLLAASLGWSGDTAAAIAALWAAVEADTAEHGGYPVPSELRNSETAKRLLDPTMMAISLRGRHIDHETAHSMAEMVKLQRRLSAALGGRTLPPVRSILRLVVALLQNASYPEDVGERLYALALELGLLAGLLAFDCGRPALAGHYLRAALQAAHASGVRAAGVDSLNS